MSAPATPHDAYMQAASKIARIRTLQADLPSRLEEAIEELRAAAETLGADPLGLVAREGSGRKRRTPGELEELVITRLREHGEQTSGQMARAFDAEGAHVRAVLQRLCSGDSPRVTRSGSPSTRRGGGYLYRLAPAALLAAERAA